jgi:4-amino-4-deoxy-L-arabinose transferase-like glycosyltransferase
MPDPAIGIITIIFSVIAIYFSWQLFRRKHDRSAILLVVMAGLALRFFTAGDHYLHEWDERYHALVAKNMIQHPLEPTLYKNPVLPYDYRDWTSNHVWLHKQPMALWTMAGSMAIFGVNEFALRLPSALFSSLGILLIFFIGSYFFDRKTGFLSAFFFAVNGFIIELAAGRMPTDHIDITFLFFTVLAVFFTIIFIQKQKPIFNILAGISIGLAILSKWLPALIVLPVWLLLVMDAGKFTRKQIAGQFFLLLCTTTAVALPWQLYIFRAFPNEAAWESSMNFRHLSEVVEGQSGSVLYYIDKIRINYGELIYIPLFWLIFLMVKKPEGLKYWALAAWFFIPLAFFSLAATKMPGYMLYTSPVLFILTAAFFWRLCDWKKRIRYPILVNILLIIFLAIPIRYAIERSKPFSNKDRNPAWTLELRDQGKVQREKGKVEADRRPPTIDRRPQTADRRPDSTLLFNYPRPIEAMFYTDWTVYKMIPDTATIRDLLGKGYRIIINNDGQLPPELTGFPKVGYISFTLPGK